MRLLRALDLSMFLDDKGLEPTFAPATLGRSESDDAFIAEQGSGVLGVDGSGGSASVPFGGITTAKALLIAPDKPVSVTLNGGTPIDVSAPSDGRGVLYLEADITSVLVTNSGTEAAEVLYALAGV